jgi:tetratricopeptide (TPR) repeat protein
VRPRVKRAAYAEEPGTTVVSVGATPGKPHDPVGWELWYPLRRLYEAGEYEQVVERLRTMIESGARYGLLFYNLASCESLTGRSADAVEHLRRSVEISEQYREYAENGSDLDAIRDEPAFKEIVGQASGS